MCEAITPAVIVSIISASIACISLIFATLSWRQANRPIISARITTESGGNSGIALNIIVENTGNRPARNIYLVASEADVKSALSSSNMEIPIDARRCFFENISIPVLANGRSISNAFGHLGQQAGSWLPGAEIPIKIRYRDLGSRCFKSKMHLLLADDAGFAQTFWDKGQSSNG